MGKRTVKVIDQRINICRMLRLCLHFHIAIPYRLRHFPLAHIFSDHSIAWVNRLLGVIKDLLEICRTAAEARRPEQKNLFVSQL